MRAIDPALVDEAWRELTSYPPGRVEDEAAAFLARQPHVAAFARTMVGEQPPAVQQAAFGLCFLLFKILEKSLGQPYPPVSEERLVEAYRDVTAWLAESADTSPGRVLDATPGPSHPTLVAHILSVFYADEEGPADYDETVRASLQLLLTTLTSALDVGPVEA